MINNDLDIPKLRLEFSNNKRIQIPDFLQASSAEQIYRCLQNQVPWVCAEKGFTDRPLDNEPDETSYESYRAAQLRAARVFHFCYDRYLIIDAMKAERAPGLLIHHVLEFFNSKEFLDFIRYFTNDPSLNMVSAQATRYRPGQFLRIHNDKHDGEGRKFAYVVNLSKSWVADWGGLLHFTDEKHDSIDAFVPLWNSLSLFAVPANHFVSTVMPWAEEHRYAITGWWHSK